MKSRRFLWVCVLLVGCNLLEVEDYHYLPYHTDTVLLRDYDYISHTASSVIYEVQISALPGYSDQFDIGFLAGDFDFEGDGTFEILDFAIEEANVAGNSSTVLLIDQSNSYTEIDPYNNRTKAINKFLEDFTSPNDFLVGGFSEGGDLTTEPVEYLTNNFNSSWTGQEFLYGLASRTGGSSSLYDAIDDVLDKLSVNSNIVKNIAVMLHSSDVESSPTISDLVTKANLSDVKIHLIIFGPLPNAADVWELTEQTGGMLSLCSTDSDVIAVFDHLQRLLNIYARVNKLRIQFTPTAGNVVSGNEYDNMIAITDSNSGYEFNPVYVKVKIP